MLRRVKESVCLRRPHKTASGSEKVHSPGPMPHDPASLPIPEGERNWTLYRLACSMRARGADEASMVSGLEEINASRCSPPLDRPELEEIAASAAKHPQGKAQPKTAPEVLKACDRLQAGAERAPWPGAGWAT